MMKRIVIRVVMAALVTASAPALASGSGSGGGGGAGFGGAGFNSFQTEEDRLQQRGRAQVKSRIACKTCEYKDGVTKQNAGEVAQAVRGGKFELVDKDRLAVLAYLRQRYGV